MRSYKISAYIIFILIAIGILSRIVSNPTAFIIPIVVFGIIIYLYKFPPNIQRRKGMTSSRKEAARKRKVAKFRVIEGSKPDHEDDTPRYH